MNCFSVYCCHQITKLIVFEHDCSVYSPYFKLYFYVDDADAVYDNDDVRVGGGGFTGL